MSPNPRVEVENRISARQAAAVERYPATWARMVSEWNSPQPEDFAWLMYSANYLFRTGGVRWALDPLRLSQRIAGAPEMDVKRDLAGLSLVVLSHRHKDHFDAGLIARLASLPIIWVVPEHILDNVLEAGVPLAQIIVPRLLEPFKVQGIQITAFDGLHFVREAGRPGGLRGVPSTGYLFEFGGKRWLFPGDTRNFDITRLPELGPVDGAFVHLWLGRAAALEAPPPLLPPFTRFCLSLRARRLVVTHLEEFGREAEDYWDSRHYWQFRQNLQRIAPSVVVQAAVMGESAAL